jgi:hypothetical protein
LRRAELVDRASGIGHADEKVVGWVKRKTSFNPRGKRCLSPARRKLKDRVTIGSRKIQIARVVDGEVRAGRHADYGRDTRDEGEQRSHYLLALTTVTH